MITRSQLEIILKVLWNIHDYWPISYRDGNRMKITGLFGRIYRCCRFHIAAYPRNLRRPSCAEHSNSYGRFGCHFQTQGFDLPKPLIPIHGVPKIRAIIANVQPALPHKFYSLCLREHVINHRIDTKLLTKCLSITIAPT